MPGMGDPTDSADPFDLRRFVSAQKEDYKTALTELRSGRKESHWMWYIFPQIDGLGYSPTSKRYAIKSLSEARAYLQHPLLGSRLVECAETILQLTGRSASAIFGSPDDMKLRSSMTLFAAVPDADPVFARVLDKYFAGQPDRATLDLLDRLKA
ncbi:MAG TPA: DUF1810 domain-containing protein [Herpetosiphonaceae bacterium]